MGNKLNEWLNAKLMAQDMSMSQLEREAGIPKGYVSKVLSGSRNAGWDFYIKAAKALDAVPEMLQIAGLISQQEEWDLSLLELFKIIKSLSPEEQQAVEAFVDYLTQKRPNSAASEQTNPAAGPA